MELIGLSQSNNVGRNVGEMWIKYENYVFPYPHIFTIEDRLEKHEDWLSDWGIEVNKMTLIMCI